MRTLRGAGAFCRVGMLGWILLLVLLCTGFAGLAVLWFLYHRTPETKWRQRVFALRQEVSRGIRAEIREIEALPRGRRAEEDALRDHALSRLVARIPVEDLLSYPGIGEATVAKLRDYGYGHVGALIDVRPRLPGLGHKRIADIDHAV